MMINKVAKIIKDNRQQTTDDRFFFDDERMRV